MTLKALLDKWNLSESVKIKSVIKQSSSDELIFESNDRDAAWEMYIYLITTIATQKLSDGEGNEQAALESIHKLFFRTREILVKHGRRAHTFAKVAVVVLNQTVRRFTAKWHYESRFSDPDACQKFRRELAVLQSQMRRYAALMADIAQVENILDIEDV